MKKLLVLALILGCSQPSTKAINFGKQSPQIQLTAGNNNDVKITAQTGASTTFLRFLVNAAGSTITGLDSSTVDDGDTFFLRNDSTSGNLTITNQDSNSTVVADRFLTRGTVPVVLEPKSTAMIEWDKTATAWTLLVAPANPNLLGHVLSNSTAVPVLTGCGTSPTIVAGSTDFAGKLTTGSAATTCTITFAAAWGSAPSCLIVAEGGAGNPTYTTSASAIAVTVDVASTVYSYICVGRS